jgi:DNA-binding NarL/FixJ family response regulator
VPADSNPVALPEAGGRGCTLIIEPSPLYLAVLVEGLRSGPMPLACLEDPQTSSVLDSAQRHQARVAIFGPSTLSPKLEPLIRLLLSGGTRSLLVSATHFDEVTSGLLLAGASGFLRIDDTSLEGYAEAVSAVASGASALHPDVVSAVLERWRSQASSAEATQGPATTRPSLTDRERDVLAGLRRGLTTRQLASGLSVAEKTVEAHKSRLYAKLGARNQAHAVQIAIECGLE